MRRIKYVVLPGYIRSDSDGQEHFIGERQLMDLYRVDPRECIVHRYDDPAPIPDDLIPLMPRFKYETYRKIAAKLAAGAAGEREGEFG